MFHIELRQFPHSAWRFNLSEAELGAVVVPWVREQWVEVGERKWNPHQAKLTIVEGPTLEVRELSMGRGWRAAQRRGADVTDRVLATATQAEQERERARLRAGASTADGAADPLALAALADLLSVGGLLGPDAARLLAAWKQVAAASPALSPSQALALAETTLAASAGDAG